MQTMQTMQKNVIWSVKRDLSRKMVYIIPKNDILDICSRENKMLFEDYS